jgi:hypothetical protein
VGLPVATNAVSTEWLSLCLAVAFPQPIAKNAVTILVNLSADPEVLEALATDDAFVESVLSRLLVRALAPRHFPRR